MVALTIIGLALVAIGSKMGQMLNTAATMRERTYASWVAQNQIAQMRLANVIPEVSSTTGETTYAGSEWRWRAVVSETGVENLFRVDVSVGYPGSDDYVRTVAGFIGEPVVPGQANRAWQGGLEPTGVRQ